MKLDALLLRGLAQELERALQGAVVRKISQLHDADFLWTFYRRGTTSHVIMSLGADYARVHLLSHADAASKPGAQTPGAFCMLLRKHLDGTRVTAVDTWGMERVLRLHFGEWTLLVELTVLERNLQLDGPVTRTWHRPGKSSVLPTVHSEPGPELRWAGCGRAARTPSDPMWRTLVHEGFGLNRLAAEEICAQAGVAATVPARECDTEAIGAAFEAFAARVREGRFEPTWSPSRRQAAPWPYRVLSDGQRFDSFSELISIQTDGGWATRGVDVARDRLQSRLRRQQEKVEKRLAAQTEHLQALTDVERWRHCGDLLLSVPPETRPGPHGVHVLDLVADPPQWVDVPVDPRMGLSANAQHYFNRYKKGVRGRVAIQHQLERGRQELDYVDELLLAAEQATSQIELSEVSELLRGEARPAVEKRHKRSAIRRYRIDGYEVLVGRNPRQNEEISIRLAHPQDVWFHAREVPGSHVLVRNPDQRPMPEAVVLRAAALAAIHSKAATSSKVTVVYTQARYLRRPPDAPPGTVTYRHESSVVVRPEAPSEMVQI